MAAPAQLVAVAVVSKQPHDGSSLGSDKPKVWTPELVDALRALNRAVRWLRHHGVSPLSVDLFAERPTIVVRPVAAAFLISEAHGVNTRTLPAGERMCRVVIDGCAIQWQRVPASVVTARILMKHFEGEKE